MNILVVDHHRPERESTLRLLVADAHHVDCAPDAKTALTILDTRMPDIVIIESTMPNVSGAELVKRIRARESISHVYIVVTAARPVGGDLKTAFQAGADDFLRKPLVKDELLARVDGLARIRRWATRVFGVGGGEDLSAGIDLSDLHAWNKIDSLLSSDVADMLGLSLETSTFADALDSATIGALLPLTIAGDGLEVCVAVGVDDESRGALSEAILGSADVDTSAVTDMLREIANVAAGAFKRMATAEGRNFTTGIPVDAAPPSSFRQTTATDRRSWIASCEGTAIRLRFEVEIRMSETKRLIVTKLREGMVVTRDLLNETGALVLRSGTRLTETHLEHLPRLLGATTLVEVVEAVAHAA